MSVDGDDGRFRRERAMIFIGCWVWWVVSIRTTCLAGRIGRLMRINLTTLLIFPLFLDIVASGSRRQN